MSSYKLTFNGRVATVPNWAGYVSYPQSNTKPYFVFEFSVADFDPTNEALVMPAYNPIWTQVSNSPNRWKLEIPEFQVALYMYGLEFLFCYSTASDAKSRLVSSNLGGGTCKLIDSGNFDITDSNGNTCLSMDRMFFNATGLTYISPIHCTNVQNVGSMFEGCTNIESGALDQYYWFNTYGVNITNHSGTFSSCGSNTQTGLDELNQIPVGWGGNMIPASTLMTSERRAYSGSNYSAWIIRDPGSGFPGFDKIKNGMYLFTQASISTYAGVSMNRSRIKGNVGTNQSTYALYFYPAFVQCVKTPGAGTNPISWIVITDNPNGHLDVGQGNTDMPGTLDYSTYGPFTREYGTYDPTLYPYFVFLVTNVPIAQWGGFIADAYGFLYNSNFKSDASLRWFF